jgi:hypothetical protein
MRYSVCGDLIAIQFACLETRFRERFFMRDIIAEYRAGNERTRCIVFRSSIKQHYLPGMIR